MKEITGRNVEDEIEHVLPKEWDNSRWAIESAELTTFGRDIRGDLHAEITLRVVQIGRPPNDRRT